MLRKESEIAQRERALAEREAQLARNADRKSSVHGEAHHQVPRALSHHELWLGQLVGGFECLNSEANSMSVPLQHARTTSLLSQKDAPSNHASTIT